MRINSELGADQPQQAASPATSESSSRTAGSDQDPAFRRGIVHRYNARLPSPTTSATFLATDPDDNHNVMIRQFNNSARNTSKTSSRYSSQNQIVDTSKSVLPNPALNNPHHSRYDEPPRNKPTPPSNKRGNAKVKSKESPLGLHEPALYASTNNATTCSAIPAIKKSTKKNPSLTKTHSSNSVAPCSSLPITPLAITPKSITTIGNVSDTFPGTTNSVLGITRSITACSRCRSRKTKCDQDFPACGACKKAKVDCVGIDAATGREVPRSWVAYLENRVKELEEELARYKMQTNIGNRCAENEDWNGNTKQGVTTDTNDGNYTAQAHSSMSAPLDKVDNDEESKEAGLNFNSAVVPNPILLPSLNCEPTGRASDSSSPVLPSFQTFTQPNSRPLSRTASPIHPLKNHPPLPRSAYVPESSDPKDAKSNCRGRQGTPGEGPYYLKPDIENLVNAVGLVSVQGTSATGFLGQSSGLPFARLMFSAVNFSSSSQLSAAPGSLFGIGRQYVNATASSARLPPLAPSPRSPSSSSASSFYKTSSSTLANLLNHQGATSPPLASDAIKGQPSTLKGVSPNLKMPSRPPASHGKSHAPITPAPMPPKHLAQRLVERYFQTANPQTPILHKPTFMQLFDRVYKDSDFQGNSPFKQASKSSKSASSGKRNHNSLEKNVHSTNLYFLNMVFAIATAMSSRPDPSLGSFPPESYHCAAMQYVESLLSSESVSNSRMDCVKGILLLALYSMMRPTAPGVWYVLGSAMRLAVDFGIHQETPKTAEKFNALELDERRRLFWSMYSIDRQVCVYLGRPFGIPDEAIGIGYPIDADDSYITSDGILPPDTEKVVGNDKTNREGEVSTGRGPLRGKNGYLKSAKTIAISIFKLRRLQSEIQVVLYQNEDVLLPRRFNNLMEWRKDMQKRLADWNASMPKTPQETGVAYNLRYVDLNYEQTRLLLYGISPAQPVPDKESFKVIAEAGSTIIQAYRELMKEESINYTWLACHNLFMAGASYLFSLWHNEDCRRLYELKEIEDLCGECVKVFRYMADRCPAAVGCSEVFENLARETISWCKKSSEKVKGLVSKVAEERRSDAVVEKYGNFDNPMHDKSNQITPQRQRPHKRLKVEDGGWRRNSGESAIGNVPTSASGDGTNSADISGSSPRKRPSALSQTIETVHEAHFPNSPPLQTPQPDSLSNTNTTPPRSNSLAALVNTPVTSLSSPFSRSAISAATLLQSPTGSIPHPQNPYISVSPHPSSPQFMDQAPKSCYGIYPQSSATTSFPGTSLPHHNHPHGHHHDQLAMANSSLMPPPPSHHRQNLFSFSPLTSSPAPVPVNLSYDNESATNNPANDISISSPTSNAISPLSSSPFSNASSGPTTLTPPYDGTPTKLRELLSEMGTGTSFYGGMMDGLQFWEQAFSGGLFPVQHNDLLGHHDGTGEIHLGIGVDASYVAPPPNGDPTSGSATAGMVMTIGGAVNVGVSVPRVTTAVENLGSARSTGLGAISGEMPLPQMRILEVNEYAVSPATSGLQPHLPFGSVAEAVGVQEGYPGFASTATGPGASTIGGGWAPRQN